MFTEDAQWTCSSINTKVVSAVSLSKGKKLIAPFLFSSLIKWFKIMMFTISECLLLIFFFDGFGFTQPKSLATFCPKKAFQDK